MSIYRRVYISKDGSSPMIFGKWEQNRCNYRNGQKSLSLKIGYKCRIEVKVVGE